MEYSEIKDTIIKYLLNEASPEETQAVMEWIQRTGENKAEFLELQALVDTILASTNPHELNPEDAYRLLKQKIDIRNEDEDEESHWNFSLLLKIAAIFVAGFLISWLLHDQINHNTQAEQKAQYQKVEVPYGSKTHIELPDGTKVTLNSGSVLKYPLQFGDTARNVYLRGEAYFDVAHNKAKPFYVNTSDIHIKVLGTSFNVKSYPEENTIETTLITGRIEIFSDRKLNANNKHLFLMPIKKRSSRR